MKKTTFDLMRLKNDPEGAIHNIIFDLGNVLIDIDIPRTLDAFARLDIHGIDPADIHPHQSGFFQEYELGNISEANFFRSIRKAYRCENVTDREIADAWCALLTEIDPVRFNMLDGLRKNYRLFVLSNTNTLHITRVKELALQALNGRDFESYFDRCFYSHEMHLRKPDREIYRQVIEQTGIIPQQTLFIDDNDCNFSGARALYLKTHHLTADQRVTDLFF